MLPVIWLVPLIEIPIGSCLVSFAIMHWDYEQGEFASQVWQYKTLSPKKPGKGLILDALYSSQNPGKKPYFCA